MFFSRPFVELLLPLILLVLAANLASFGLMWFICRRIRLRREIWLPFALLAGPLALVAFAGWAIYSGTVSDLLAGGERFRIQKAIRAITGDKVVADSVQDYGYDEYVEKLIGGGRLPDALSYVQERLHVEHQRENVRGELVYREYLARIEQSLKGIENGVSHG